VTIKYNNKNKNKIQVDFHLDQLCFGFIYLYQFVDLNSSYFICWINVWTYCWISINWL